MILKVPSADEYQAAYAMARLKGQDELNAKLAAARWMMNQTGMSWGWDIQIQQKDWASKHKPDTIAIKIHSVTDGYYHNSRRQKIVIGPRTFRENAKTGKINWPKIFEHAEEVLHFRESREIKAKNHHQAIEQRNQHQNELDKQFPGEGRISTKLGGGIIFNVTLESPAEAQQLIDLHNKILQERGKQP